MPFCEPFFHEISYSSKKSNLYVALYTIWYYYQNVLTSPYLFCYTQLTFTCSNSTVKTLEKRCKIWRQWRRSGVFIVNFEHISHHFSSVSIVDFRQENVSWVLSLWSKFNVRIALLGNVTKYSNKIENTVKKSLRILPWRFVHLACKQIFLSNL